MRHDIIFDSQTEASKERGVQYSYRGDFASADTELGAAAAPLEFAESDIDKLLLSTLLRERALNALRAYATGGDNRTPEPYEQALRLATEATVLAVNLQGVFADSLTYRTEVGKSLCAMGRFATTAENRKGAQRLYFLAHRQLKLGSDHQATSHNALLASREARIDDRRLNSLGWLAVATWHAAIGVLTADTSTRRAEDVFMARLADVVTKKRAVASVTNSKKTVDGNIVNA